MSTYTTTEAAAMARCSFRMADYWCRTGVVVPSRSADGSGSRREWTDGDVRALRAVVALSGLGAKVSALRLAVAAVRAARWHDRFLTATPATARVGPEVMVEVGAAWVLDLYALDALPPAPEVETLPTGHLVCAGEVS